MAIDLPTSPATGTKFDTGSRKLRWSGSAWDSDDYSALFRNRIVNSAMTVSQENAQNAAPWGASGQWYTADQWICGWGMTGATITAHSYNPDKAEAGASPWPGNAIVLVSNEYAYPVVDAGNIAHMYQWVEAANCSDFLWGTANARPVVLRFAAMAEVPGQYTIAIHNWAQDRTFIAPFTIPPGNLWTEYVIPIPGDTTGTWPSDIGSAILVAFTGAAGSTFVGVPGWQAGGGYTLPGNANFMNLAAYSYLRIAKVGLYLDPFKTGIAPAWVQPQHAEEELKCLRYWCKMHSLIGICAISSQINRIGNNYPVKMRVPPAVGAYGTMGTHNGGSGGTVTAWSQIYTSTEFFEAELATTALVVQPNGTGLTYNSGNNAFLACSARF